jgi:hypothetical protein
MSVEHSENLITIELPHDALSGIAETPEWAEELLEGALGVDAQQSGHGG